MISILLSAVLSCEDASWIIQGVRRSEGLSDRERSEIILEIMISAEDECDFVSDRKRS